MNRTSGSHPGSPQKPGGKDAMNKVAGDLQAVVTQAESGHRPSAHQALTDAQVVAGIRGS